MTEAAIQQVLPSDRNKVDKEDLVESFKGSLAILTPEQRKTMIEQLAMLQITTIADQLAHKSKEK